jgi:hypothetical protein
VWRALLPALTACLLAACSGGGGSPALEFGEAAGFASQNSLLILQDLPVGWAALPGGPDATDVELSGPCDFTAREVVFPEAAASAQSETFGGPDERETRSFAATFASEAEATAAMTAVKAMVARCRDEYLDALNAAAEARLDALGIDLSILGGIEVSLDDVQLDVSADELLGYRGEVGVHVVGYNRDYTLDIAVLRAGRMMGVLTYSAYDGIDGAEESQIAGAFSLRLREADESLPR